MKETETLRFIIDILENIRDYLRMEKLLEQATTLYDLDLKSISLDGCLAEIQKIIWNNINTRRNEKID